MQSQIFKLGVSNSLVATAWPAYCCVPAFVKAALNILDYKNAYKDRGMLARSLDTRVESNTVNPWNLLLASDPDGTGVTASTAKRVLPSLLREIDPHLFFRHIPLNTIALELYQEVAHQASQAGAVIGIGFNSADFINTPGISRHLCRITLFHNNRYVYLIDDSKGCPPPIRLISWENICRSSIAINDGFWVIGPESAMKIDSALPWSKNLSQRSTLDIESTS